MRPQGSAMELEARRRRAAECFQAGESIRTVADRLGVNLSSAKRWKRAWRDGGVAGLSAKPHPGGVSKLTVAERNELVDLVVAEAIRRRFGVESHPGHVARLLHELGFSPQKPRRIAREQDPDAVERRRREDWPRIKKKPADGAQLLFFSMKRASACSL